MWTPKSIFELEVLQVIKTQKLRKISDDTDLWETRKTSTVQR